MSGNTQWLHDRAKAHLTVSADTKYRVAEECLDAIIAAVRLLAEAMRSGCKVLLCGNGGSAADCQHIAAEFVSTLTQDFRRPGLKAVALTTDTSLLTAYANDFGFEGVFARQVETLGAQGDVLIGISTSGNSKNILAAVQTAKISNMRTVVLTGRGGRLREDADVAICVPSTVTAHIQESHIAIGHILCDLVERSLFTSGESA